MIQLQSDSPANGSRRPPPALSGRRLAASVPSVPPARPLLRWRWPAARTYDPAELLPAMQKMFDQLGGLGRLVKGKTVAIKINLTGAPTYRLGYLPLEDTHYTHPQVIAAAVAPDGPGRRAAHPDPGEPLVHRRPGGRVHAARQLGAARHSERRAQRGVRKHQLPGHGKKYSRLTVPYGGYIFPAFDLNHSYEDCDVFVSIAKMKEHATAGITLSMKNCFGLTPCTIYGDRRGRGRAVASFPKAAATMVHAGNRQPSKSAPPEKDPSPPRRTPTACRAPWWIWWPRVPSTWRSSKASRP